MRGQRGHYYSSRNSNENFTGIESQPRVHHRRGVDARTSMQRETTKVGFAGQYGSSQFHQPSPFVDQRNPNVVHFRHRRSQRNENEWKQQIDTYISSIKHFFVHSQVNNGNLQRYSFAIIGIFFVFLSFCLMVWYIFFNTYTNGNTETMTTRIENDYSFVEIEERGTIDNFLTFSNVNDVNDEINEIVMNMNEIDTNENNNENENEHKNDNVNNNNEENEASMMNDNNNNDIGEWIRITDIDWYCDENYRSFINNFVYIETENEMIRASMIDEIDRELSIIRLKYLDCDWSIFQMFVSCDPHVEMNSVKRIQFVPDREIPSQYHNIIFSLRQGKLRLNQDGMDDKNERRHSTNNEMRNEKDDGRYIDITIIDSANEHQVADNTLDEKEGSNEEDWMHTNNEEYNDKNNRDGVYDEREESIKEISGIADIKNGQERQERQDTSHIADVADIADRVVLDRNEGASLRDYVTEIVMQITNENQKEINRLKQNVTELVMRNQEQEIESEQKSANEIAFTQYENIKDDNEEFKRLKNKLLEHESNFERLNSIVESSTSQNSAMLNEIRPQIEQLNSKIETINDTMKTQNSNRNEMNNNNNNKDIIGTMDETDYSHRIWRHSYLISCDDSKLTYLGCLYLSYFGSQYSQVAIKPDLPTKPGDCIPLSNKDSEKPPYIAIELYRPIQVTKIGIFHIRPSWLPIEDVGSAPQNIVVSVSNDGNEYLSVGEYIYNYSGPSFQTFELSNWKYDDLNKDALLTPSEMQRIEKIQNQRLKKSWKFVGLQFMSNGGADYTCIYRARVYGNVVDE